MTTNIHATARVATNRGSYAVCDCGFRSPVGYKADALRAVDQHRTDNGLAPLAGRNIALAFAALPGVLSARYSAGRVTVSWPTALGGRASYTTVQARAKLQQLLDA